MEPSDEFKRRMLEPIETLFQEAMDAYPVSSLNGGRNYQSVEGLFEGTYSDSGSIKNNNRRRQRKTDEPAFEEAVAALDKLVGLEAVKDKVRSLANLARIETLRRSRKLSVTETSLHAVFTGNPGTGKTTVARLIGRILHSLGFLSSGHLIEVDKSNMVGGYLGQTPGIVVAKMAEARGGVLFVDEAYAFAEDEHDFYGREAISTLVKAMEDQRDDLVVIVAGYPDKMRGFVRSNPGIRSRFPWRISFADYTPEQLQEILRRSCESKGLNPTPGFWLRTEISWRRLYEQAVTIDGNGRLVRTAMERVLENQAARLSGEGRIKKTQLQELLPSDWDGVEETLKEVGDV